MNRGVFSARENACVRWRPLVAEEALAQAGRRVHGGRLDSFCPKAQEHPVFLAEIVLTASYQGF